jgi:2-polyprenyl-3-methyl-5-hydroxy-6-metoxy-1,4-benzoquinol methylase
MPTEQELAALYVSRKYFEGGGRAGYAGYAANAPQLARTFNTKLTCLLRHGPIRDLLEIGCGPGYLLDEARRAGIAAVVGVDPNPWAVEEARRRGLEVHAGSIEAVPPGRAFDAAVMLDLLEHVSDPLPFLRRVRERLRPGGRVLIMTPNIRSVLARVSGRRWVSFKIPEHVHYYSPRSVRRLLEGSGFEVISIRGSGQYVTVAFMLDRLSRLAPRLTAALAAAARALAFESRVVFVTNGSMDVLARAVGGTRPA